MHLGEGAIAIDEDEVIFFVLKHLNRGGGVILISRELDASAGNGAEG